MRHPDFFPGPGQPHNSTQRAVDERLCETIKRVWRESGYLITAEVVCVGAESDKSKNPIWGIRSNLINGMPSGRPILVRP